MVILWVISYNFSLHAWVKKRKTEISIHITLQTANFDYQFRLIILYYVV